jgi:hypothetical protein
MSFGSKGKEYLSGFKTGDLVIHKYGEEILGFYKVLRVRGFVDAYGFVADLLNVHTGGRNSLGTGCLEVIHKEVEKVFGWVQDEDGHGRQWKEIKQ